MPMFVEVKVEPESSGYENSVSDDAHTELYEAHQVKEEIVIGPELLQFNTESVTSFDNQNVTEIHIKIESEDLATIDQAPSPSNLLRVRDKPVEKNKKEKKKYSCEICNKKFVYHSLLVRHNITHTGERNFPCKLCDKQFSSKSYLILHSKLHTGDTPYSCDVCKKLFTTEANLTSHKRQHTGEKPFSCKICRKKFTNESNLTCHQKTHKNSNSYKCEICNKGFKMNKYLIKHKISHSNKKYSCELCNKCFTRKDVLDRHILSMHTGEIFTRAALLPSGFCDTELILGS